MNGTDHEIGETRKRILETAALVFAEHGFAATTVRMICGLARVNLAAVNYHFGGKESLYREAIRHARRRAYERFPVNYGMSGKSGPEEQLHAFIRSFLLRTSGDERNLGFGTLVMREMVDPTSALDMMLDEGIRALLEQLAGIVRELLGNAQDRELVLICTRSIVSQCLLFLFSRSVMDRMAPEHKFDPEDLEGISRQVLYFSLNAIRGISADFHMQPGNEGIH
ncbi:MAG: CerR family C-terminal domain-containing protein [Geobacteraceae bacterium]|nr:CerR family C-terminal domain-containing protein [Geobacteraceae bacterium]